MSNTTEPIGERKRVGPEDEAREDQMDDNGLGVADEDEQRLPEADAHGTANATDPTTA